MLKSPFLLKIIKQAVGLLIGVFVVIAHNSNLCKRSLKDLQSVHVVICYVCRILWYIEGKLNQDSIQKLFSCTDLNEN